jgi:MSHA biogenesis protein MshL
MTTESRRIAALEAFGRLAVGVVAAMALVLSCASPPAPGGASEIASTIRPSRPPALEPLEVTRPDDSPRPAAVRLLDATRVSLNFQDADLASVLLGLGRDGPLDVVVDSGVVGRVTVDLRDVSLLHALAWIIGPDHRYSLEDGVLHVSPIGRETRLYRVEYPNYSREGSSEVALGGFIGAAPSLGEGETGGGLDQDSSLARVTTTHRMDFWTELEQAVRTIVFGAADVTTESAEPIEDGESARRQPRRRVQVSRQAALVSATAEPAILDAVERYLEAIAERMEYQVLIDAQFVEITLGDGLEFGIDYEVAANHAGVFARLITPGLNAANLVQSLAPTLNEGGIKIGYANDDFGAILRAVATQTDVRVVSTPRITTLNNHKAMIKVVRNEVFFVGEVDTIATDQTVLQTTQFKPHVIPVGVTLDVTPQVSSRAEITLHIHPSVSEIVDIAFQPTTDPDLPQNGSLPVVDLRESDSVVRVAAGTTIAIGGLVRTRELEKARSVPLLGALPWLGVLFKRIETEEVRTELVIFLTPHLLDPPQIKRVTERLDGELAAADALRRERGVGAWWQPLFGARRAMGTER